MTYLFQCHKCLIVDIVQTQYDIPNRCNYCKSKKIKGLGYIAQTHGKKY